MSSLPAFDLCSIQVAISNSSCINGRTNSPDHRRRGYGIKATAALIEHLVDLGIEAIVLNVEMANRPAIDMYRNLGFIPYCGFYEGIAVLT
ncbi:MAG: GNAT family N-acetyltransferase [Anaerolineales bacterium]